MLKRLLTLSLIILGAIGMNAQTISGTVTNSSTSAAIANHTVYLLDSNSSSSYLVTTSTNANGAYSFTNVPSNNFGYLVFVYDCQQQQQTQFISSNTGTATFSICVSGNPTNCTAAFSSTPDTTYQNLIYFTDQSTGSPTSWTWNFGDGTSSSSQNPNHVYATIGTYNISLIISSSTCSDTITQAITISSTSNPCAASFYSNPDSTNANTIHFTNTSTGNPTAYHWFFGDYTNGSNQQNPSHTYASSGTYTVVLVIISANCTDSINQVITVGNSSNPCSASFTSIPDSVNPNTISFLNTSAGNPTSWYWTFGDGTTSNLQNPSHTYASQGTYNVTLSISSANCGDSTIQTITIGSGSTTCQAIFNYYPDTANPNTINFIDASTGSPYGWSWSFGDGTSSNLQHPTHTYANAGTYIVNLTITSGQPSQPCTSTTTQNVIISGGTPSYSISGAVYANSTLVLQGTVALFDTQTSQFIASTPIDSTGYIFANVATGIYNIFAIPDTTTAIGQNFGPTYYGDIIFWSGATAVSITNANQTSKIINLVTIPSVPGGNGSISGNVGTGSKAGTADAVVNLLNNSLQLVATTKTDANGDYSFANLAYDTYKIWVEIAGKTTTPITVTLTSTSGSSNTNDFIVTNTTVVPKTTSVNNTLLVGEFKLYPNPVSDVLNIEIKTEENGIYSFNMFNVTGQLISSEQINITSGSNLIKLNTNELSQGTYILRIQSSGNNSIQKLFVK